jgi:hypothetical protein
MRISTQIISLLTILLIVSCSHQTAEKTGLVNPPIPSLNPAFVEFDLNASSDTVVLIPNSLGTTITYKANSLIDKEGNIVTGMVKFKYREFHNAYSTILAGIPMNYNEKGRSEHFETAGMFELRAFKENDPVSITNENPLGVKFGGKTEGDDFPFFYLEEENNEGWKFLGEKASEINLEKKLALSELKKKKEQISSIPFEKNHFVFNYDAALDIYFKDDYKKIRSNYKNSHVKNKIKKFGLDWIPAHTNDNVNYKGSAYPAIMMVWKNLSEKPFPSWSDNAEVKLKKVKGEIYEIAFKNWDSGKTAKHTAELVMPIKSLFAFSPESWKTKYDEQMAIVLMEEERFQKMADVFRYFEINNFGIYNYDKFINTREAVSIAADFNFEEKIHIENDLKIFCVLNDGRGLMTFSPEMWKDFAVFKNSGMKIFTILPPNKIAMFPTENIEQVFSEIKKGNLKNYSFAIKTTGALEKPEDLELALK